MLVGLKINKGSLPLQEHNDFPHFIDKFNSLSKSFFRHSNLMNSVRCDSLDTVILHYRLIRNQFRGVFGQLRSSIEDSQK